MTSSSLNISIRWKWLMAGVTASLIGGLSVWLLHDCQMGRISQRLIAEARSEAAEGNLAEARTKYDACVRLLPQNPVALEEYAMVVLQGKATVENQLTAFNLLDAAMLNGATGLETRLQFFRTAAQLQRFSAALHAIDEIEIDAHRDPELHTLKGFCLLQKGSFDDAKTQFNTALKLKPGFPEAWRGLVEVAQTKSGDIAALAVAEKMVELAPGAASLAVKARCLEKTLRIKEAGQVYWAAAKHSSADRRSAESFADFIMRSVPPDQNQDVAMVTSAFKLLSKSVDASDYMSMARVADLAHRLGKHEIALRHYQRCLESRPNDEFALGRITELHIAQREFAKAHATVDLLPQNRSVALLSCMLRGNILLAEGRPEDARIVLEDALKQSGDSRLLQGAYYTLIQALRELKLDGRAVVVAKELLFISSESDDARELYVESLAATGQFDAAVSQLTQFDDQAEYLPSLIITLIEAADAEGRTDQLERHVASTRFVRVNSSIPNLYQAYALFRQGRAPAAVSLLTDLAHQFPERPEYFTARTDVASRVGERLQASGVSSLGEVSDADERFVYGLAIAESKDADEATSMFREFLTQQRNSADAAQLVREIVRQLALNLATTEKAAELAKQLLL